jgi:hypothetical protein
MLLIDVALKGDEICAISGRTHIQIAHSYFLLFSSVGRVTVTFGFPKLAWTASM